MLDFGFVDRRAVVGWSWEAPKKIKFVDRASHFNCCPFYTLKTRTKCAKFRICLFLIQNWKHMKQMLNPPVWGDVGVKKWSPFLDFGTQSIHSKSEKVCGFYFSVSKNLRKKCVNSYVKISRQKCVNHKNHKNLVSMWYLH